MSAEGSNDEPRSKRKGPKVRVFHELGGRCMYAVCSSLEALNLYLHQKAANIAGERQ